MIETGQTTMKRRERSQIPAVWWCMQKNTPPSLKGWVFPWARALTILKDQTMPTKNKHAYIRNREASSLKATLHLMLLLTMVECNLYPVKSKSTGSLKTPKLITLYNNRRNNWLRTRRDNKMRSRKTIYLKHLLI